MTEINQKTSQPANKNSKNRVAFGLILAGTALDLASLFVGMLVLSNFIHRYDYHPYSYRPQPFLFVPLVKITPNSGYFVERILEVFLVLTLTLIQIFKKRTSTVISFVIFGIATLLFLEDSLGLMIFALTRLLLKISLHGMNFVPLFLDLVACALLLAGSSIAVIRKSC